MRSYSVDSVELSQYSNSVSESLLQNIVNKQ